MPVIINDFEIVAERQPGGESAGGAASSQPAGQAAPASNAAPSPRALDIRRIHEHIARRKLRLFAH